MSKFSRFMKTNKVVKVNEKYAPTTSLLDDNGCPLEWEFRHITSKENDTLRESCTSEVQITGKPNLFRPKMDTAAYVAKMIVQSTVCPDLYDKELQDSYGVGNCKITRVWNSEFNPAEMIPSADVTKWYKTICNSLEDGVKQWLTAVYQNASNKKLTVGGTVLVTVVNSYDYGEVSDVLISQIQTELDPEENAGEGYGIAPIGHVVRVKSATPVVINIKTTLTYENGYSWSKLQTSVEKVIQEYLLELRKEWADASVTVVRISQIEARILSINGIIDAVGTTVNESTENISLGTYEIPVFGGIIV